MEVIINPPKFILLQSRASVARLAHNQEVGGSIPSSAPNFVLLNLWACTGFDSVIDL